MWKLMNEEGIKKIRIIQGRKYGVAKIEKNMGWKGKMKKKENIGNKSEINRKGIT